MKYLLGAACLLLMGAGCMQTSTPVAQPNPPQKREVAVETPEPRTETETETETSSSQIIETGVFSLVVSEIYQVETEYNLRIQNFIGSDDPRHIYADNAFFIEIFDETSTTKEEFSLSYDTTTSFDLVGTEVIKGEGRRLGGEGWLGHAYFEPVSKTIFNISYRHPEGRAEAEAILQNIEWK